MVVRSWLVSVVFLSGVALSSSADVAPPLPTWHPGEFRTVDGTRNNAANPTWGCVGSDLIRMGDACYADGVGEPPSGLPGPRVISNLVLAQDRSIPSAGHASDLLWQWGQFLDHDIDLTPLMEPREVFSIEVPPGDPWFDPSGSGTAVIDFDRSVHEDGSGVRQQRNMITAYIDASNVYGSDPARAEALRTHDGTGRLRLSADGLLPFNVEGFPNAPTADDPSLFLSGDVRANEQVGLTALHTLFAREHNYWAARLRDPMGRLSGDEIYAQARAMVGAEIQVITYREFLPRLLGPDALPSYRGYDHTVNAGIMNEFSTAAFRLGHSMLSATLARLDAAMEPAPEGPLPLRDAFFSPAVIEAGGVDPIIRGLAGQTAQEIDPYVVDDVRNFLFGAPGQGGVDLASLNIQRGRDHGLPRYNEARHTLGLRERKSFVEVTSDLETQDRLAAAYGSVDRIDLWVGELAEDHVPGAMVGETMYTILVRQFTALRDGDRFWYENAFPADMVKMLEEQTLARIIRRNTGIGMELADDVFTYPPRPAPPIPVLVQLELSPPSRNPLPMGATATFTLDRDTPGPLRVSVYDVRGRLVRMLMDETRPAGPVDLTWDGRSTTGATVPGVYFIQARTGTVTDSRKIVVAPGE